MDFVCNKDGRRVALVVLDSVGIGALPDANEFSDQGAHTLGNIYAKLGKLHLPNMYEMGLAHIENARLPLQPIIPIGAYGRAMERTKAKDTTSGHWEMMGLPMQTPFKTYKNGFPADIIKKFESLIGRGVLGNCVASGTEIIQRLGDEHMKTGKPIVYTSADSVFQIAAHEKIISVEKLYEICEAARALMMGDDLVGRVIARPFLGESGAYYRTENRKDYAVPPFAATVLDALTDDKINVVSIGKIEDIFCKKNTGIVDHTKNNATGIASTIKHLNALPSGFIFVNLVDFDMLYGHRNDVEGYALALEAFDIELKNIINAMREDDVLIITADHGCDPVTLGTDHTREYVPILVYGKNVCQNVALGTRTTFADIGATVYELLTGKTFASGTSFAREIIK